MFVPWLVSSLQTTVESRQPILSNDANNNKPRFCVLLSAKERMSLILTIASKATRDKSEGKHSKKESRVIGRPRKCGPKTTLKVWPLLHPRYGSSLGMWLYSFVYTLICQPIGRLCKAISHVLIRRERGDISHNCTKNGNSPNVGRFGGRPKKCVKEMTKTYCPFRPPLLSVLILSHHTHATASEKLITLSSHSGCSPSITNTLPPLQEEGSQCTPQTRIVTSTKNKRISLVFLCRRRHHHHRHGRQGTSSPQNEINFSCCSCFSSRLCEIQNISFPIQFNRGLSYCRFGSARSNRSSPSLQP